jgi:hypothetical protein
VTDDELAAFARLRANPDDASAHVLFGLHVLYSQDPRNDPELAPAHPRSDTKNEL